MTCIVGLAHPNGHMVMAADSMGAHETYKVTMSNPKLMQVEKDVDGQPICITAGYAGCWRFGQLLEHQVLDTLSFDGLEEGGHTPLEWMLKEFIPHLRKVLIDNGLARVSDNVSTSGNGIALMMVRDNLFEVQADFSVLEPAAGLTAIGSGYQYALGALHATQAMAIDAQERAYNAVQVSGYLCPSVGGQTWTMVHQRPKVDDVT